MKLRNIIKKYKNYNIIFIIFIIMLGLCIYLSLTGSESLIEGARNKKNKKKNKKKDLCEPRECENNLTKYTKCVDIHNIDPISRRLYQGQLGEVVYHCPKKNVEIMTCNVENDTDKDHNGWVLSICAPEFSEFNSSSMTEEQEKNIKIIQQDISNSQWIRASPKFETPNFFQRLFS